MIGDSQILGIDLGKSIQDVTLSVFLFVALNLSGKFISHRPSHLLECMSASFHIRGKK